MKQKILLGFILIAVLTSIAAFGATTSSDGRPYGNFNFLVEIEGVTTSGFKEVQGFSSTSEVIEYREGGDTDNIVRKQPGVTKAGNLVLKRGFTGNLELWQWRKQVVDGNTQKRAGTIALLDADRTEVARFQFYNAWPVRYEIKVMDGLGSNVLIEEVELAVEELSIE